MMTEGDFDTPPPTDADAPSNVVPIDRAQAKEWIRGLIVSSEGRPIRGLANTLHVLSTHPDWLGVLAYDAFAEAITKISPPPTRHQDGASSAGEWTEADSTRTVAWFAAVVGFEPTTQHVDAAVAAVAERTVIHPVRNYLRSLTWDGTCRLDTVLSAYFGASDTDYTRAVGARWMISAVARVMEPGCQADSMLVIESRQQGTGKSTALEALASPEWFADTGISIGDKDSYQALRARWIYELGELDSIRGREITRVKMFLSARTDTYRPSYGRRTRQFPRQTVFAGSTNESEYLVDSTGNRRFWPICCRTIDVEAIRRDRDQLWAEAVARYDSGSRWHLDTPELRALAVEAQAERQVDDPWIDHVRDWLGRLGAAEIAAGVTTARVLSDALHMDEGRQRHDMTIRAGHVLRACGWESQQVRRDGTRVRIYTPSQPSHGGRT
jgi:putative DNA primase/helicase